MPKPKRIGEQLLEAGLINQHQLLKALERQKTWGGRLGSNLVLIGAIKEHDLMRFMALKTGVREMNVADVEIGHDLIQKLPQKVVEKFHVLPVYMKDKKTMVLAVADPTDLEAIDQVSFITGLKVEPVVSSYSSILQGIHKYYFGAQLRGTQNQEITIESGYLEEDMEAHGGHGALEDPDLIIFGKQSDEPETTPDSTLEDVSNHMQPMSAPPPPINPHMNPAGDGLDFDFDTSNSIDISEPPEIAAAAPMPNNADLDQFDDQQKLLGLYHVLIKKRLVTEAEIAQELMKLWSLGKLK